MASSNDLLVSDTSSTNNENQCSICLETLGSKKIRTLECNHNFHEECLKGVRNKQCPLCRFPFESNVTISTDSEETIVRVDEEKRKRTFYTIMLAACIITFVVGYYYR